jgi:hypothetical protein
MPAVVAHRGGESLEDQAVALELLTEVALAIRQQGARGMALRDDPDLDAPRRRLDVNSDLAQGRRIQPQPHADRPALRKPRGQLSHPGGKLGE